MRRRAGRTRLDVSCTSLVSNTRFSDTPTYALAWLAFMPTPLLGMMKSEREAGSRSSTARPQSSQCSSSCCSSECTGAGGRWPCDASVLSCMT